MGKYIVVAGPTASGKSSVAIQLAKQIGGYIINADSRQVYKQLVIGTAQPTPDKVVKDGHWVIGGVDHFLYGHMDIKESYNIARYQKEINDTVNTNPNRIPILVGGTGLYIDSIIYDYQLEDFEVDRDRRRQLEQMDIISLQKQIPQSDVNNLNDSDINNPRRLIRIIERLQQGTSKTSIGDYLADRYFVLDPGKEVLEERIKGRTEQMFKEGLLCENDRLHSSGVDYNLPSLQTIGYREFVEYFNGNISLDEVKELVFVHTRQYARKQRTWFRRNEDVEWVESADDLLQLYGKAI